MSKQFNKKKALDTARDLLRPNESIPYDVNKASLKKLFDALLDMYGIPTEFNSKHSIACMFFNIISQSKEIDEDAVRDTLRTVHRMRLREASNKIARKQKLDIVHSLVIGNSSSGSFYSSPEWQSIRYKAFDLHGNHCQCCGRHPTDGVVMHVDHIIPRVLKPELSLDVNNLQILCELCNMGKRADYITDWRQS